MNLISDVLDSIAIFYLDENKGTFYYEKVHL